MSEPEPRDYRSRAATELVIYALSIVVLLYALAVIWLVSAVATGQISSGRAVLAVIALGLLAPVCPWALGHAVRLQAKQSTRTSAGALGALSWRPGPRLRRARRSLGARWAGWTGRVSPERAHDMGIVVLSLAAFWAFFAQSLVAAVMVPVTVHWLRRRRAP